MGGVDVSGQLYILAALTQVENPPYFLNRRVGGPQSQSSYGGRKTSLLLPGIQPWPPSL